MCRYFRLAFAALLLFVLSGCDTLTETNQVRQAVPHAYGVGDPQFRRSLEAVTGAALIGGNHTETLLNGDEIFPPC